MSWVTLQSKRLKKARYNVGRQILEVRIQGEGTVKHHNVLPHMAENFFKTSDPDFYYRYYLEDSRVVSPMRGILQTSGWVAKAVIILAAAWLLSYSSLSDMSVLEASNITTTRPAVQ
ncbi:hypothetical protein BJF93_16220 [Xaviernesmea oryzae]|uniref:KTSC domain-containing protein n=1 Tax=Xaviernesmea oryzae TaxID=464029 RepID=A0A1Q9ASM0_9HYPH|nr:hypothetical protein [Xaviernesmea oryzae]OLP58424.1 hypothetical protein BJF93_16220 [Xaviernesmea oryzae]SEM21656.1 hypothetical protein SAMN04487976_12311 [Xaviernesmea oryzae]